MNQPYNSVLERDRQCDLFEKLWYQSGISSVEKFLEQQPKPLGSQTIDELILVEVELRFTEGERPKRSEYESRFPSQKSAVGQAFERIEKLNRTRLFSLNEDLAGTPKEKNFVATDIPDQLGEFDILRSLGAGAFGVVYKARDRNTQDVFALKFPRTQAISSLKELVQIRNEAEIARHMEHPAIVRSYGMRDVDDFIFIVQQFVCGNPLKEVKLGSTRAIVEVIASAANGLAYAHKHKLVHRDLKPDNIMIDSNGQPLIIDFGLALHESAQRRLRGQRCGTPPYMSPEQVMGLAHQMDGRSDIWALGIILYELLVGQRPFDGDTQEELFEEIKFRNEKPLRMVKPELDHELQRICLRCLAKPIRERYPNADELSRDLHDWLQHEEQWKKKTFVPLVPRGLRPYGPQDAEAFVELLPGHRDRHGVPESIQFWKRKLESFGDFEAFTVGAIIGPSGSGKSSFVRAGVLPRLDPQLVRTVYVEATAINTEQRLRNALDHAEPQIPDGLTLPQIFDGLKNQVWSQDEKRLLIVIDQFEQWLANTSHLESAELTEALRYCDGKNLFCIVLLRDDFWLKASRFFGAINEGWMEGHNIQRIDLISQEHAYEVLFRLGRTMNRIPNDQSSLSTAQQTFLTRVVSGLAVESEVVCVHVALFSEMFKNREWTNAELDKVGGLSGVGEKYLEENFDDITAIVTPAKLKQAATQILDRLLPNSAVQIRDWDRNVRELRSAVSELTDLEFNRVIDWLDQDLRLITKVNPIDGHDAEMQYQLSHDYLVPSVRNWLNRKKRETWQGRAEKRLSELAKLYRNSDDPKFLPSPAEYASIRAGVPGNVISIQEKRLLRDADIYYLIRLAACAAVTGLMLGGLWLLMNQNKSSLAHAALNEYLDCPSYLAGSRLTALDAHGPFLRTALRESLNSEFVRRRIRSGIALDRLYSELNQLGQMASDFSSTNAIDLDGFEFRTLSTIDGFNDEATKKIRTEVARLLVSDSNDEREARCRLAITALAMQDSYPVEVLVGNKRDPTDTTILTDLLTETWPDAERLASFAASAKPDFLFTLVVSVANMDQASIGEETRNKWRQLVVDQYEKHPDAGIHHACTYFANRWGFQLRTLDPTSAPIGARNWWVVKTANDTCLTFIRVEPGRFHRGLNAPKSSGQKFVPSEEVNLTNSYWLSSTEIPLSLLNHWVEKGAAEKTKQRFQTERYKKAVAIDSEHFPAYGISIEEALAFSIWLNDVGSVHADESSAECVFSIPTSDEWEMACRAGSESMFHWGDMSVVDKLKRFAVYTEYMTEAEHEVIQPPGSRVPNRWGFLDITGNVSELTIPPPKYSKSVDGFHCGGHFRYNQSCCSGWLWNLKKNNHSFPAGIRLKMVEKSD